MTGRQANVPCVDHHFIAALSLTGMVLDMLGGLYLAYDLLGGQRGPLRLLVRVISYALVYFAVYGLLVRRLDFTLTLSVGLGVVLGLELALHPGRLRRLLLMLGRALVIGLGTGLMLGARFGMAYALFNALLKPWVSPHDPDISPGPRLHLSRAQLAATLRLCLTNSLAAVGAGCVSGSTEVVEAGIWLALILAAGTGVAVTVSPFVEWEAENLPERRLGVLGVALIAIGMLVQSIQYWVVYLDIPVR